MPFDPKKLGDDFVLIGKKQTSTGNKIQKYSGTIKEIADNYINTGKLNKSLDSIEEGARSVQRLIIPIPVVIRIVANKLENIKIPKLAIKTKEVDFMGIGKLSFVTGITITNEKPFEPIAESLKSIAENIENIGEAILTIANGINDVQKELPKTRELLLVGAADMEQAGKELIAIGSAMEKTGNAIKSI